MPPSVVHATRLIIISKCLITLCVLGTGRFGLGMSNRTNCESVEAAFCRHVMQLYSDNWPTARPRGKALSDKHFYGKLPEVSAAYI